MARNRIYGCIGCGIVLVDRRWKAVRMHLQKCCPSRINEKVNEKVLRRCCKIGNAYCEVPGWEGQAYDQRSHDGKKAYRKGSNASFGRQQWNNHQRDYSYYGRQGNSTDSLNRSEVDDVNTGPSRDVSNYGPRGYATKYLKDYDHAGNGPSRDDSYYGPHCNDAKTIDCVENVAKWYGPGNDEALPQRGFKRATTSHHLTEASYSGPQVNDKAHLERSQYVTTQQLSTDSDHRLNQTGPLKKRIVMHCAKDSPTKRRASSPLKDISSSTTNDVNKAAAATTHRVPTPGGPSAFGIALLQWASSVNSTCRPSAPSLARSAFASVSGQNPTAVKSDQMDAIAEVSQWLESMVPHWDPPLRSQYAMSLVSYGFDSAAILETDLQIDNAEAILTNWRINMLPGHAISLRNAIERASHRQLHE